MDKIIVLFMLASIVMLMNREPKELFIYFFLPILTVMPTYFDTKVVPGFPELGFWSAVLLPIAFVWLFNKHAEGYRFSPVDLLILLHLVVVFSGQWHNSTYKEAQKVFYNDLTMRLLPFVMARAWFMDRDSRIRMFLVITITGAVVGFFLMYEMRMWVNIFDTFLRKIWPHSVPWEGFMKRGGLKRACGPFAHPICAGYFFTMFVPLAIWLWKNDYYKLRKHGMWIVLLSVGGGIASISRAPIIGIFLGFVLIWYGWQKSKTVPTMVIACMLILVSIFIVPKAIAYINVTRATAETEDQRNAAYRNELMDNYKEIIEEKPLMGWGRFTVPVVKGQDSIDNEYLLITLQSGKAGLYAYLSAIVWVLLRLIFYAANGDPEKREIKLAWCFIASILTALFTQATVYAGTQTVQFFYILLGFSEGLMQIDAFDPEEKSESMRIISGDSYGYNFSRTL